MERDELIEKCAGLISGLSNIKWDPINFPGKPEESYNLHNLIGDGGAMYYQLQIARKLLYEAVLELEKETTLES